MQDHARPAPKVYGAGDAWFQQSSHGGHHELQQEQLLQLQRQRQLSQAVAEDSVRLNLHQADQHQRHHNHHHYHHHLQQQQQQPQQPISGGVHRATLAALQQQVKSLQRCVESSTGGRVAVSNRGASLAPPGLGFPESSDSKARSYSDDLSFVGDGPRDVSSGDDKYVTTTTGVRSTRRSSQHLDGGGGASTVTTGEPVCFHRIHNGRKSATVLAAAPSAFARFSFSQLALAAPQAEVTTPGAASCR